MPETRAPVKKWRVMPADGDYVSYTSEQKAFGAAQAINDDGYGKTAIVEHWEKGRWVLWERLDPDGLPA